MFIHLVKIMLLLFTLLSPQNSHCQCNDDEQYVYYEQTQHTLGVINKIIIHPSGCLQWTITTRIAIMSSVEDRMLVMMLTLNVRKTQSLV